MFLIIVSKESIGNIMAGRVEVNMKFLNKGINKFLNILNYMYVRYIL